MQNRRRDWIFGADESQDRAALGPISRRYLEDESKSLTRLLDGARLRVEATAGVMQRAKTLVEAMRRNRAQHGGLDALMLEYDLSSAEGIVLMCLAEALMRIPDDDTADRLIADKLGEADFHAHLGTSESLFVNASTWALMLTGRIVHDRALDEPGLGKLLGGLVARLGEPVIRSAMRQAMRIMGHQFVMGRTIGEALKRAADDGGGYRYSFDMLGEASLTADDAERYAGAYANAIRAIGRDRAANAEPMAAPGVSVKLSALSPRFEYTQHRRAAGEIAERLKALALIARDARVALTVDAEECDRLELTLDIFRRVLIEPKLSGWPNLGIAVQAYQKRAGDVLDWLARLAGENGRVIPVRLVKGAYWDGEIKRAQEQGLAGYPVFTRKSSTDVAYLACAKQLLGAGGRLYPQFATHNAHTVAWLLEAGAGAEFEFQRLHGMGDELYTEIVGPDKLDRPCRVYAPVGSHKDLLPYLMRRLLENGANTSFVNRFVHDKATVDEIVEDPVALTEALLADPAAQVSHPKIPLPRDLFAPERVNSAGLNLTDTPELGELARALAAAAERDVVASPLIDGRPVGGAAGVSRDPSAWAREIGRTGLASVETARQALDSAGAYFSRWRATAAPVRSAMLRRAADLLETHRTELVALCVTEGGRTVPDALAEVREAVDFLRYYACECERQFGEPVSLPGPAGERNTLRLLGRGVFLCISPWNFPVAIFTGQIAAALAAGNTVLAKPAESTTIVAGRVVELMHAAGVPVQALQFLPGSGAKLGAALLPDPRIAGVAFTGSTATAKRIERTLAERDGPLAALIAETGGVNAMIVDSSALPEQVVRDVTRSAFNSAGQRCSALRLLCLQRDTADDVLRMLVGCMAELVIGDPALLATDVGPVIDPEARTALLGYIESQAARVVYQCPPGDVPDDGCYVPPTLIEIDGARDLTDEVFGPVLHVLRFEAGGIDALVGELNTVGFGLTLGIHSRIDSFAEQIADRARVGNVYVNRNMIGAVVGSQPFGGMGLSGTGPKAGGPYYLSRFAVEQAISINTAAVGGNASLLSL